MIINNMVIIILNSMNWKEKIQQLSMWELKKQELLI